MPRRPAKSEDWLRPLRNKIEKVDHELLLLLAQRRDLVVKTMALKRVHHMRLIDVAQERRVRRRALGWAKGLRISAPTTRRLFQLVLRECKSQALTSTAPAISR